MQFPPNLAERTAVLERDLYHASRSLEGLNTRMLEAEDSLRGLESTATRINERLPLINKIDMLASLFGDLIKYATGIALFLLAISGAFGLDGVLRALITGLAGR
jgi:hypothetical protein